MSDAASCLPTARGAASVVALALVAALAACGRDPGGGEEPPDVERATRDLDREGWAPRSSGLPGLYGFAATGAASSAGLEKLGYASGSAPAPGVGGVIRLDVERSEPGYTLLLSGHASEAQIVDAQGAVVHSWSFAYASVPNAPEVEDPRNAAVWRTARVLPDGGLLALFEGHALVRLTRDSELVWSFGGRAHHALDLTPDGDVLVLTRRVATVPWVNASEPVYEDCITRLGLADGRESATWSVLEAFERSAYRELVTEGSPRVGDLLHTNALRLLDGTLAERIPAFRRGNVLISMRHTHALAIVDLQARRVVWAKTGDWRLQHDPSVLADGNLLLFDNAGYAGSSQVIEVEPRSGSVAWAWRGDPPESFFTLFCGSAQRLSGGNTLITESCRGRAFEVTRGGDVVWDYVNPHRAGEHGELIAALFDVRRLPRAEVDTWLER